jgi:hypothetical protein
LLVAGRALLTSEFRIITDEDQLISVMFLVMNGDIDPEKGFTFADFNGVFYIEMSGYRL